MTSDWANAVQGELVNVIQAAGLTLDKTSQTQLLTAMQTLGRIKLNGTLNLYVSPSGNDTANTGLSADSPFLTMQRAWTIAITKYDLNNNSVTIHLADGTYSNPLAIWSSPMGTNGFVNLIGNTGSPQNVVLATANAFALSVETCLNVSIQGISLGATGTIPGSGGVLAAGILIGFGGNVTLAGPCIFNTCSSYHVWIGNSGYFAIASSYTIGGGALAHILCGGSGAYLNMGPGPYTVTLTGTPAFSTSFIAVTQNGSGQLWSPNVTFSGSATGYKYSVSMNGTLSTNGGGNSYLPGSINGITGSGGQIA